MVSVLRAIFQGPLHGVDGQSQQTPQDPSYSDAILTRATDMSYGFDDIDSIISIFNIGDAHVHEDGYQGAAQAPNSADGQ